MAGRRSGILFRANTGPPLKGLRRLVLRFTVAYAAVTVIAAVSLAFFPKLSSPLIQVTQAAVQSVSGSQGASWWQTTDVVEGLLLLLLMWVASELPRFPVGFLLTHAIWIVRAAVAGLGLGATIGAFGWRGAVFDLLALGPWNILTGGAVLLGTAASVQLNRFAVSRGASPAVSWAFGALYVAAGLLILASGFLESRTAAPLTRWLNL
ncbi:MAG: hypothetical protein OWU32_09205 [Firmicutes bacterium]|nr:hypothetical protein [Bacillota bacterium]